MIIIVMEWHRCLLSAWFICYSFPHLLITNFKRWAEANVQEPITMSPTFNKSQQKFEQKKNAQTIDEYLNLNGKIWKLL